MQQEIVAPPPSYYRGEQPLIKSFMILGVIVAFFVQVFAFPIATATNNLVGAPWGGILLFVIVLPYLWFASVSIWRSAARSGSLLAAVIVKTLVVFWVAPWAVAFFYGLWTLAVTES